MRDLKKNHNKTIENSNWTEYILKHSDVSFKAQIKNENGKYHHFLIGKAQKNKQGYGLLIN